jgi:ribosomal protein L5
MSVWASAIAVNRQKEEQKMNLPEIKKIAINKGVTTGKMKKVECIRAIQEAEGNSACFDTGKAAECGQDHCLWRKDCK